MTLEYLHEFCVAARLQNISKAADLLYTTQPTLSRHISELEKSLSVQLIRRDNRVFELTPAGEFFYREIQETMDHIDEIKARVQQMGQGKCETMRIASFNPYIPYVFDRIVQFRKGHPEVSFKLLHTAYQVAELVLEGKMDIGITFSFSVPPTDNLETLVLGRDDLCVVVPQNHPLATSSTISFTAIQRETILMLANMSYPLVSEITNRIMFGDSGDLSTENRFVEVENLETALMHIRLGDGITLLPRIVAQERAHGCILLGVVDSSVNYDICMCWKKDNRSMALKHFLQFYQET